MPVTGVAAARSPAMIAALPRKKANGETRMRALRIGTSFSTREPFCCRISSSGLRRVRTGG
jgi:hypothetical protein